jgi:uncharacterized protein (DUF1800 family)
MLLYLDSASNRKAHPNENFARELMELFCLGEGQYTELDIRELAALLYRLGSSSRRIPFQSFSA